MFTGGKAEFKENSKTARAGGLESTEGRRSSSRRCLLALSWSQRPQRAESMGAAEGWDDLPALSLSYRAGHRGPRRGPGEVKDAPLIKMTTQQRDCRDSY